MDVALKHASVDDVRAAIARHYLGTVDRDRTLGAIELHDHQLDAAKRLRALLQESAGALLADEVGLGKTYTAIAVARDATHPLIVAPASLLPMWRASIAAAGLSKAEFVSHEKLSRSPASPGRHDLLVVDEAHHARNPATRRYRELSRLASGRRVLLLSATPVHNSERDIRSLFALFWGSRAWSCTLAELGRFIVRREQRAIGNNRLPVARAPVWLQLAHQDDLLDEIMALPPPLPASDGGDGGALVAHALVRQWASSDAALANALARRKAKALALIAALEEGRYPSSAELRAWIHSEDSLQLAFPTLVAPASANRSELLSQVRAHEQAITRLRARLRSTAKADGARVGHLRELRQKHPGARIVAFSQFADTARALFSGVAVGGGAAVLTARGGLTVGGRLTRAEILARFNADRVRPAERIDLLIATDLLSEGIDLPEASVVVHLDVPWTPARLEQRVGRAVRMGSRQPVVHVYCMAPPASAQALLRVEGILRRKLHDAARLVGITGTILPSLQSDPGAARVAVAAEEALRATLARWRRDHPDAQTTSTGVFACVRGEHRGGVALLASGSRCTLVVIRDEHVTDDAEEVSRFLEAECAGAEVEVREADLQHANEKIASWITHSRARSIARLSVAPAARSGVRLLRRIEAIADRAPFHRRSAIAALAGEARRAVLRDRGIAAERVLAELADAHMGDDAWLRAVGAFASTNAERSAQVETETQVLALLLVSPP